MSEPLLRSAALTPHLLVSAANRGESSRRWEQRLSQGWPGSTPRVATVAASKTTTEGPATPAQDCGGDCQRFSIARAETADFSALCAPDLAPTAAPSGRSASPPGSTCDAARHPRHTWSDSLRRAVRRSTDRSGRNSLLSDRG